MTLKATFSKGTSKDNTLGRYFSTNLTNTSQQLFVSKKNGKNKHDISNRCIVAIKWKKTLDTGYWHLPTWFFKQEGEKTSSAYIHSIRTYNTSSHNTYQWHFAYYFRIRGCRFSPTSLIKWSSWSICMRDRSNWSSDRLICQVFTLWSR